MIAGIGGTVSSIVRSPFTVAPNGRETEPGVQENAASPLQDRSAETAALRRVQQASESEKSKNSGPEDLSEEEERQVDDLKRRDAEVQAHEQAHAIAGGAHSSAPSYEYTVGPDGKRYATSGEVKIDSSPVRENPEATIRKMEAVIRAALAPSDPSSQDLQVARQAQEQRAKAQLELVKKRETERTENSDKKAEDSGAANTDGLASRLLQANAAYGVGDEKENADTANEVFSLSQQLSIFA